MQGVLSVHRRMSCERLDHQMEAGELGVALHPPVLEEHGDTVCDMINTSPTPVLVVGDAELTAWAMQDEVLVSTIDGARGRGEVQRSATMIRTFRATYPVYRSGSRTTRTICGCRVLSLESANRAQVDV